MTASQNQNLGRLIATNPFQMGQARVFLWIVVLVGPIAGPGALFAAWLNRSQWPLPLALLIAAMGIGIFLASGFALQLLRRSRSWSLAVHEHGVEIVNGQGSARFQFEEIREFGFGLERNRVSGVDGGFIYKLSFALASQAKSQRPFQWACMQNGPQPVLEQLRDHVTSVIARRFADQLDSEGICKWTAGLTLKKEGVQYLSPTFKNPKQTSFVSFDDIDGATLDRGMFYMYEVGNPNPVYVGYQSVPNFHPGFTVFEQLLSNGAQSVHSTQAETLAVA